MSKTTCLIVTILGLLALMFIGWNLSDADQTLTQTPIDTGRPTYQSEQITTAIYSHSGGLNYRIVADYVQYFASTRISWFTRPVATVFDENKVPTWMVKADQAKLTHERMLYLYGHVQVDSLTNTSQVKYITTDNAVINLITQSVFSNEKVTLYGSNFNSTGMKMRGNLRNKTAELIEKVKTSYEV